MIDETPQQLSARRGFSLSYQGKTLLSVIDPIGQAERAIDAIPKRDRTLYVCPSPLYGYGLDSLLEQLPQDSAVLCIEIDKNLMDFTLAAMDRSLLGDRRFRLVRTEDSAALCAFVRDTWGNRSFRRVVVLRLTGGWQVAPTIYEALAEALQEDITTTWSNAMTLVRLGRRYHRNALLNLGYLSQSQGIEQLRYGAAPILVVGAGPSLDRVIPAIKAHFGNSTRPFKIICVDTALSALKSWDLKPDLAVALESQLWNLKDFIGLGSWRIPAAIDLSAYPATAGIPWSATYFFFTPWTNLRLFDRLSAAGLLPETIPPLGSVGLSAVALARKRSAGPILLAGLDFAYFPEAFHARDTPGHRERLRVQTRLQPIPNPNTAFRRGTRWSKSKDGRTVRTNLVLQNYRNLFIQEFSGDPRIADLTGSGLNLGIEPMSLEEGMRILEGSNIPGAGALGPYWQDSPGLSASPLRASDPQNIADFIQHEQGLLHALRKVLTGEAPQEPSGNLELLLDELDYLWAHFPDCAGREGKRPPGSDISFLKRVRAEIDPALKLLEQALHMTGTSVAGN